MAIDLGHWQSQHGPLVTFMVSASLIGLIVCVVMAVYLHLRERRMKALRREHYEERATNNRKKSRRRKRK